MKSIAAIATGNKPNSVPPRRFIPILSIGDILYLKNRLSQIGIWVQPLSRKIWIQFILSFLLAFNQNIEHFISILKITIIPVCPTQHGISRAARNAPGVFLGILAPFRQSRSHSKIGYNLFPNLGYRCPGFIYIRRLFGMQKQRNSTPQISQIKIPNAS